MQLQEVTLHTGRRVMKGLTRHTPEYRGRLLGRRSMRRRRGASPASCLQSGDYWLDMYFNATYGCCTGSAWMEILNYVYGIKVAGRRGDGSLPGRQSPQRRQRT